MDEKTSDQIQGMKDKLYQAFTRVSAVPPGYTADFIALGRIAESYAALVQADVADTQNMVRACAAKVKLSWEKK